MNQVASLLNGSFLNIRQALDEGQVSSRQLTEESLRRAHASQGELNSIVSFCDDLALTMADEADERLKKGERNPLLGIPVGVKDLILAKGFKATASSQMLSNFVAPYDATVVSKLKQSGAPIVAKLNLDEFAMGSSNETSFFGAVKNPFDLNRVPGGSSGGSAAFVASRISPLSLGTDTGGSIRQPSSFTGLTGIKPTYGRVSRYGVIAFASSLDQVGPMCSDAMATAATLEVISGRDIHDATSSENLVPNFLKNTQDFVAKEKLQGLRIGIPKEYFGPGVDDEVITQVRGSLVKLEKMGARLVEVSLPLTDYAMPVYYVIATSEASSNLARYDGVHFGYRSPKFQGGHLEDLYAMSRGEGFGQEVRLRIAIGTYALSAGYYDAFYKKAAQVRRLVTEDFKRAFQNCDVIAAPTSPTTAFLLKEKTDDPIKMYLADVFTLSANLAAIPALSMNCGFDGKGLPIGFQLMGRWWDEETLLGVAAQFQNAHPETLNVSPYAKKWEVNHGSL